MISLLSEGVSSEAINSADFDDFLQDVATLWEIEDIENELRLLSSTGIPFYWLRANLKEFLSKTPTDFTNLDRKSKKLIDLVSVDWLLALGPRVQSSLQMAFWGLAQKIQINYPTSVSTGRVKQLIFLSFLSSYIHQIQTSDDRLNQNSLFHFYDLTIELNEAFFLIPMLVELTFLTFDKEDWRDLRGADTRVNPPHGIKVYLKENGQALDADDDHSLWKAVRRNSVSATDARKLVKLNGEVSAQRGKLLEEKLSGDFLPFLDAFALGIQREPEIAKIVQELFPEKFFIHNRFLAIGANPRHVATPDMVGESALCEIKVSTKPLKSAKTTYRDQLQWQMHVTGYEKVLFVVENRYSEELEYEWVIRDEARISTLVHFADEFITELDSHKLTYAWEGEDFLHEGHELNNLPLEVAVGVNSNVADSDIDYSDHFDDLPTVNLLSKDETKEALILYLRGFTVYQIATEISRPSNDVVGTLGVYFYELDENLVNPLAGKFRHGWSFEEMTKLSKMFYVGESVDRICAALDRDRLGVLYKIFVSYCPEIPNKVAKSFNIKH